MTYEIRLTNVPDGAYAEQYLCTASNGDGSPDKAYRSFEDRAEAEQVVREFYTAKSAQPSNFEPDMEAEVVEAEVS